MTQTAKRIVRHLALAAGSGAAVYAIFAGMDASDPIFKLSMATAYVGLALLAVTLAIGPLNVLRSLPNPVSTNVRRDVAIWAGIWSLVHVVPGLQMHLRGSMELYFFSPGQPVPVRYDPFGIANWTGLIAGAVLLTLLALSNDVSLVRLGTRRWKSIQRWSYWAFGLVFVHGILYQLVLENRERPWVVAFLFLVALGVAAQAAGFRRVRRGGTRAEGAHEPT